MMQSRVKKMFKGCVFIQFSLEMKKICVVEGYPYVEEIGLSCIETKWTKEHLKFFRFQKVASISTSRSGSAIEKFILKRKAVKKMKLTILAEVVEKIQLEALELLAKKPLVPVFCPQLELFFVMICIPS